jgi:Family of unknown function (DUF6266)
MGIISKGILGGFSGTVGNVVGRTFSASQKQLEQHAKFSIATKFVAAMSGLFMISFRNFAIKMTGNNSALSYLLSNAITGTFPTYSIDYSNMLMSRGDLPNILNPTAVAIAGNDIKFNWTDNSGTGKAKATDKAMLVLYCPAVKQAIYTTGSALRSAGSETLNAAIFTGEQVETYIGFISEDGRFVANSIYTGPLTVTA